MLTILTNLFPVWVLAGALLALARPEVFTWFSGPLIPWGLAVIMLGMGLTLSPKDFEGVVKDPKRVALGLVLQYTVMPSLGWMLGHLFGLPAPLAVGLVLVASCPGGTASNVVTYLAKADVALSVTMTSVSTLIAVILTPALTTWLASSRVDVNGWGLFWSTVQVVVLPVLAGVLMNRFLPALTRRLLPVSPLVAVLFITLIVSSIVGQGKARILDAGWTLVAAVFALHAFGFFLGYVLSRLTVRDRVAARTVSIEVGMQNSGLGAVLARQNFADPLVAIPSAISSVFHSVIASALAAVWSRTAPDAHGDPGDRGGRR
jgi:BASS family bile acid:Na+ symporter